MILLKKKKQVDSKINNKKSNISGKSSRNKELLMVTYLFVGVFIILMGYFVYFNLIESPDVINSPYNSRQDTFSDRIVRGSILSKDGEILAKTNVSGNGTETRDYPYDNLFSHVIGFSINGKSGVESIGNFSLLRSNAFFFERLINELKGEKNIGDNLLTTLDLKLQQTAYDVLGGYKGAIVVMEPDTGKILAMVSKPDFNPNEIGEIWDSLVSESDTENSVLLNRATQGLYPPGSIFKIITALEYMRENPDYKNYTYNCTGSTTIEESKINCYKQKAHGEQTFYDAFANSCNSAFAEIGLDLNLLSLSKLNDTLMFNSVLPIPLPYSKSSYVLTSNGTINEIMQTSIGQGETLVSPLHMALITSAIANEGMIMRPYLIDSIENYNGDLVKQYTPTEYKAVMTSEEAATLSDLMENVVTNGTGSKLKNDSYTVAGKTGSAEFNSKSKESHSWFVGFSSTEETDIVVSVIVEGAGAGSEYAVPMAKQIFDAYYK